MVVLQCGVILERQDDPLTDGCETNLDNDDPGSLAVTQIGNRTMAGDDGVADVNVAMRPKLLALKHPLDDITRIVCKSKVGKQTNCSLSLLLEQLTIFVLLGSLWKTWRVFIPT